MVQPSTRTTLQNARNEFKSRMDRAPLGRTDYPDMGKPISHWKSKSTSGIGRPRPKTVVVAKKKKKKKNKKKNYPLHLINPPTFLGKCPHRDHRAQVAARKNKPPRLWYDGRAPRTRADGPAHIIRESGPQTSTTRTNNTHVLMTWRGWGRLCWDLCMPRHQTNHHRYNE